MESWHYYLMATLYSCAGILHFLKWEWYARVIPDPFPKKRLLVYLSGLAEIFLGILLLLPAWKDLALWGIILMLFLFLPVHLHMAKDQKFRKRYPLWLLLVRIPLQFLLMYWAFSYL